MDQKKEWLWVMKLSAIGLMLLFGFLWYHDQFYKGTLLKKETKMEDKTEDSHVSLVNKQEDDAEILDACVKLYEEAEKKQMINDLETIRHIIKAFGEKGYSAVDSKNQIDMTEPEQVLQFCESANTKQEAEITIWEVNYYGGFAKYDLKTKDGVIDVVRKYFEYQDGSMQEKVTEEYSVESWEYTEEGYFMFSGSCASEQQYVLSLSDTTEHKAFRVLPLEEKYREWNRKYLLSIGYARNNMFITDWSEEDFGELDFYDVYDFSYPIVNGKKVPYEADENLSVRAVYQIPKDEFESVVMTYFNIDSQTLQSKTVYDAVKETYEYKPRGLYEAEYPEYPYPEVVGNRENRDGTMTLLVHVVFPYAGNSKVFAHEVVIRPLKDGNFQYVSNRILPSGNNEEETWYTPRMTDKEWEEEFIYVEEHVEMKNPEKVESFYDDYQNGRDTTVTVYEKHRDGTLALVTFVYQKKEVQTHYAEVYWNKDGLPERQDISIQDVSEIELTPKGYFIYTYKNAIAHASLRQYWRIKPLPEKCRELTEKYISGLSYVNYNILVTNWDSSNVEDILMPCMYEDIYRIHTGENLKVKNCKIPAEEYEKIMMTYLPVSVEQLKKHCKYDEASNSYAYEMIFGSPYPPFGEVMDYKEHSNGTITLMVDGVWPDYKLDQAFRNEIVVQPFEDGTFRYLSNSVWTKETSPM